MSAKLIRLSNRCDLMSLGAHLVCCGVPALATLLSLISTAGLTGTTLIDQLTTFADNWHSAAFWFSTVMVSVAVVSYFLARKRDCVAEGHCQHPPCAPRKTASWRMLSVSLVLYVLNLCVFLFG